MGLNNHLWIGGSPHAAGATDVQFRWGEVREHDYSLGQTVKWGAGRLVVGRHFASGISVVDFEARLFKFYKIEIVDGVLTSVEEINEDEYDTICAQEG